MIDENTQMKLLRGDDIKVDDDISIKSYTISEIMDKIGFDTYNNFISYIVNTPYDIRASLYENDVIHTEVSHWDLFLNYFFNKDKNNIIESCMFMIGINLEDYVAIKEDEKISLVSKLNKNKINSIKFNYLVYILREINGYPKVSDEPKFGNRSALVYEIERHIRRIKKNRKLNGDVTIKSIISSLSWSENSLNINNIWDLTLYQLYDGLNRKMKKDRYDNIMLGIYTGNIKQDTINFSKENWFTN